MYVSAECVMWLLQRGQPCNIAAFFFVLRSALLRPGPARGKGQCQWHVDTTTARACFKIRHVIRHAARFAGCLEPTVASARLIARRTVSRPTCNRDRRLGTTQQSRASPGASPARCLSRSGCRRTLYDRPPPPSTRRHAHPESTWTTQGRQHVGRTPVVSTFQRTLGRVASC